MTLVLGNRTLSFLKEIEGIGDVVRAA